MVRPLGDLNVKPSVDFEFQTSSNSNSNSTVSKLAGTEFETVQEKDLTIEDALKFTESLNEFLEKHDTKLRFKFHDKLEEYYVTIVNSEDEVVREIPSKKLLDIFAAMNEYLGLIVDKKI